MNLLEAREILKNNGYSVRKLNECGGGGCGSRDYDYGGCGGRGGRDYDYGSCGHQDSGCGSISFSTAVPSPRLKKSVKEQITSVLDEFGITVDKFNTIAGETSVSFTKNNEKCKFVFKVETGELSGLWVNDLLLMCRDRLPTNNELKTFAILKNLFKSLNLSK